MCNCTSIIIPLKNRFHLAELAIESAIRQSGDNEIIVVDDGSDEKFIDHTKHSSEIRVIRNEVSLNAAYSRNIGARQAVCKTIAFLDSDDVWADDHLEVARGYLNSVSGVSLYFSPLVDQDESVIVSDPYHHLFNNRNDFRSSCLVCSKEAFFDVGGFDKNLEKHQDWDFALRAKSAAKIIYGDRPTVKLDTVAPERMSSRMNVAASIYFFQKHMGNLTQAQKSFFWSQLLVQSVLLRDLESWRIARDHFKLDGNLGDITYKRKLFYFFPRLSWWMNSFRLIASRAFR